MQASKPRPARVNLNARIPASLDRDLTLYAARRGEKKQDAVASAIRLLLRQGAEVPLSLDAPLPRLRLKRGAGQIRSLTGPERDAALFG